MTSFSTPSLPLRWPKSQAFFLDTSNADAHRLLLHGPWPGVGVWIYGPSGCGKSCLSYLWAQEAWRKTGLLTTYCAEKELRDPLFWPKQGDYVIDLSASDVRQGSPVNPQDDFQGDALGGALCEALHAGMMRMMAYGQEGVGRVLWLARLPPGLWYQSRVDSPLPDVLSRLNALFVLEISQPSFPLWRHRVAQALKHSGWNLSSRWIHYLAHRLPRTHACVCALEAWSRKTSSLSADNLHSFVRHFQEQETQDKNQEQEG